jgi:pyrroloquinoline quinone biosynthesis protein E
VPVPRPYTLVAELTHRCPLRCAYCSNPIELIRRGEELDAATWCRVLREAEALGVVSVNLTGGEPLLRDDVSTLVAQARRLDLYTTLITSGVPATRDRLARLRDDGLDAVQLSIQDVDAVAAARVTGCVVDRAKLDVAAWVRAAGLPLTLNVVLHRGNVARTAAFVALAEALGAERLELANAQYLGWALVNRRALLPGADAIAAARAVAAAAAERLRGRMEVVFVVPDYHRDVPPPCMDGWGRRFVVVAPDGRVFPCHAASAIPGLAFADVRSRSLARAWADAPGMNAFRGDAWMPEPCRSCARRDVDFGGCRCQAHALTGDAAATDPICALAPRHAAAAAARMDAAAVADPPSLVLRAYGAGGKAGAGAVETRA